MGKTFARDVAGARTSRAASSSSLVSTLCEQGGRREKKQKYVQNMRNTKRSPLKDYTLFPSARLEVERRALGISRGALMLRVCHAIRALRGFSREGAPNEEGASNGSTFLEREGGGTLSIPRAIYLHDLVSFAVAVHALVLIEILQGEELVGVLQEHPQAPAQQSLIFIQTLVHQTGATQELLAERIRARRRREYSRRRGTLRRAAKPVVFVGRRPLYPDVPSVHRNLFTTRNFSRTGCLFILADVFSSEVTTTSYAALPPHARKSTQNVSPALRSAVRASQNARELSREPLGVQSPSSRRSRCGVCARDCYARARRRINKKRRGQKAEHSLLTAPLHGFVPR